MCGSGRAPRQHRRPSRKYVRQRFTEVGGILYGNVHPESAERVGSSTERVVFRVRECAEGGCGGAGEKGL